MSNHHSRQFFKNAAGRPNNPDIAGKERPEGRPFNGQNSSNPSNAGTIIESIVPPSCPSTIATAQEEELLPRVRWDMTHDAVVHMTIPVDCMRQIAGMAETSNQSIESCTVMIINIALLNYLEQGK